MLTPSGQTLLESIKAYEQHCQLEIEARQWAQKQINLLKEEIDKRTHRDQDSPLHILSLEGPELTDKEKIKIEALDELLGITLIHKAEARNQGHESQPDWVFMISVPHLKLLLERAGRTGNESS